MDEICPYIGVYLLQPDGVPVVEVVPVVAEEGYGWQQQHNGLVPFIHLRERTGEPGNANFVYQIQKKPAANDEKKKLNILNTVQVIINCSLHLNIHKSK